MKYTEYLQCARKHLDSCVDLFDSYCANQANRQNELSVYLELYYLLGYVIEGFTVYSVYKLNNWPQGVDIQKWHTIDTIINDRFVIGQITAFTLNTGLDFYKDRKDQVTHASVFPRGRVRYFVESHRYKFIVNGLLASNPAFNNIPYFGNGYLDPNLRDLIDNWEPGIRYYYPTGLLQSNSQFDLQLINNLNESNIRLLIDICKDIIIKAHQI